MAARSNRGGSRLLRQLRAELRGNPRKRLLLLALLPVIVLAWVPVLRGSSSSTAAPTPRPSAASLLPESAAEPPVVVDLELRARMGALVEGLDAARAPSWREREGEQPFGSPLARPGAGASASGARGQGGSTLARLNKAEEEALAETLVPTCTFLSSKRGNVAIIGGGMYRVGDRIEGFSVQEIKSRAVVLQGQHGVYERSIPLEYERTQNHKRIQ